MKIPVMFANGTLGAIGTEELDELLEKEIIIGFRRASGWAMTGKDELRSNRADGKGSWRDRKNHRPVLNMQAGIEAQSGGAVPFQWEGAKMRKG